MANDHLPPPHNDYRPRSPDLSEITRSSFPRLQKLPSYKLTEHSDFPVGYSFSPRGSYDASPYFSPQSAQPPSYFGSQIHQTVAHPAAISDERAFSNTTVLQNFGSRSSTDARSTYQTSFNLSNKEEDPGKIAPLFGPDMARLRSRKPVDYNEEHPDVDFEKITGVPSFADPHVPVAPFHGSIPAVTAMPVQATSHMEKVSATSSGIRVRTGFPVARIKRIIQADEDVGKVAIATPPAMATSLELFMVDLVIKGAQEAASSGTKKITATHLKNALLKDPQYDFLNDICENTADECTKKSRAKSEAKSEESDEDIKPEKITKRATKGGKRKKNDESE